ncbi:hypothetical protein BDAP_002661 [Binucleata daphniae]
MLEEKIDNLTDFTLQYVNILMESIYENCITAINSYFDNLINNQSQINMSLNELEIAKQKYTKLINKVESQIKGLDTKKILENYSEFDFIKYYEDNHNKIFDQIIGNDEYGTNFNSHIQKIKEKTEKLLGNFKVKENLFAKVLEILNLQENIKDETKKITDDYKKSFEEIIKDKFIEINEQKNKSTKIQAQQGNSEAEPEISESNDSAEYEQTTNIKKSKTKTITNITTNIMLLKSKIIEAEQEALTNIEGLRTYNE